MAEICTNSYQHKMFRKESWNGKFYCFSIMWCFIISLIERLSVLLFLYVYCYILIICITYTKIMIRRANNVYIIFSKNIKIKRIVKVDVRLLNFVELQKFQLWPFVLNNIPSYIYHNFICKKVTKFPMHSWFSSIKIV